MITFRGRSFKGIQLRADSTRLGRYKGSNTMERIQAIVESTNSREIKPRP